MPKETQRDDKNPFDHFDFESNLRADFGVVI